MSQENVEALKRGIRAYNRRDVEALLAWLDPEVEWRPVLPVVLGGEATVYRGHEGVRELFRDLDEVFAERHVDFSEIHEAGEHVIATGRLRTRGKSSEALIESPFGWVSEFKDGKIIQIRTYLDPSEALEPFGLSK
jgi:ketosteroid isomerase-like protein